MGAHSLEQGGGALALPWKSVEKCYRVKKTPSPKSVLTAATLLFREERPRMIVQHRLLFHFCIGLLQKCVVLVFWRRTKWRRTRSPDFGLGSQCWLSPDFTIYTGDQGQNHSLQWSSRGHKLYRNLFAQWLRPGPAGGAYIAPRLPSWWGGGSQLLPKNPTPARPFEPRLTICPPLEKILWVPMSFKIIFECVLYRHPFRITTIVILFTVHRQLGSSSSSTHFCWSTQLDISSFIQRHRS